MSEQRSCWVCGAAFGEHEYKLLSSAGSRHKDRDICIDILMEKLANAEAALRKISDCDEDDALACIVIANKALGLKTFVGNPPNSAGGSDAR